VTIVNAGGWEIFSDGRIGGFVSYTNGDGFPVQTATSSPTGGGIDINTAAPIADPMHPDQQPKIESWRIRSGFLGNILGVGVRHKLSENTTLTGYFQFWSDIETEDRRKYLPMPVDVREGFFKIEGPAGSISIGRQLTLFSRGAAEIDFLYGHGYALGYPGSIDSSGPAAGHIGTGVMGPGFGAGIIYTSPNFAGVQLTAGVFDPVKLVGSWPRTKELRPEAELTYDAELGSSAKVHVFVNGVYQRVYQSGDLDSNWTAASGVGFGARVEVGPVHLGVAGHYGQGLGLYYALETSSAAYDQQFNLRKSDGYYAQAQVVLGDFDINAGVGISRIYELPTDGLPDANGLRQSVIESQLGISGVVVYHFSPSLHASVDYLRANYKWHLGEKQDVNFVNTGMTVVW
jgi:hypothetical protein